MGSSACPFHDEVVRARNRACEWLLAQQQPDGHWVAELEGDSILETEYVLLLEFLGISDPPLRKALCEYALNRWQNAEGGMSIYPGGPSDVSASVKAYFACKLAGYSSEDPRLRRLRECILRLGGVTECNTFTKLYLAIFGQYDWDGVPTIPPEIVLLPTWFYLNVYAMSSWSRAILIPLAVINAFRPHRPVPPKAAIDELFVGQRHGPRLRLKRDPRLFTWRNLFITIDRCLKLLERFPYKPLRGLALRKAERWLLEHQECSDGLGAIFPAMTHAVMAYTCLGYGQDHQAVQHELRELTKFMIRDERGTRLQPCVSPVWDTAIALNALLEAGVSPSAAGIQAALNWLLDREVRRPGDWSRTVRGVEPAGWAFEYRNEFYPDVDDTVMVLMALNKARTNPNAERLDSATYRAVRWILAMQSRNGGWAAFDKDNTRVLLQYVPYADHNAMLDPPTADITARVVECLSQLGISHHHPAIRRAVSYLLEEQEPDGSWYGRWGVNYIYGTWQALRGLSAAGFPASHPAVQKALRWLVSIQHEDGGWGELPDTYNDPTRKGQGPSTASQTAWAVMGLMAAGAVESDACQRGIAYLLETQRSDGSWDEEQFTGTGFPRVFYLRYHYYRHSFPLWALGVYARALEAAS